MTKKNRIFKAAIIVWLMMICFMFGALSHLPDLDVMCLLLFEMFILIFVTGIIAAVIDIRKELRSNDKEANR